ncbi:MAG: amidohydrolase family protein [Oscillospiraceae bacterium]|nr:amidohydrolase family protein [Oscillospiraceae bacterium]
MQRIDFFAHVLTPRYLAELDRRNIQHHPTPPASILYDAEERIAVMDEYAPGDTSVLTMMGPNLESLVDVSLAEKLAQTGNDELAELLQAYPDHFIAAAASLPMDDMTMAQKECRRVVEQLGLKGIQIVSNYRGEYPDSERLYPLYEMMEAYDLPVWIHPVFANGPMRAPFDIESILGWPMDTSMAMFYIARSEVFERFPRLKFVVHHCGAFIPAFYPRIKAQFFDDPPYLEHPVAPEVGRRAEYLKNFYADTAIYGHCTDTLELGLRFFGPEQLVYATDFPSMTPEELPNTIYSVEQLPVQADTKEAIFRGNALRLLHING